MTTTLLFAVLAHWLLTMYVVEAEIFRPLRDRLAGRAEIMRPSVSRRDGWEDFYRSTEFSRPKIKYLLGCRMCSGFWVALLVGLAVGINPLVIAALSHWLFIAQRIAEKLAK